VVRPAREYDRKAEFGPLGNAHWVQPDSRKWSIHLIHVEWKPGCSFLGSGGVSRAVGDDTALGKKARSTPLDGLGDPLDEPGCGIRGLC
jgi:hypothetical protein